MVWPILRRPTRPKDASPAAPLVVADIALDVHTAWLAIGGWMVRLPGREAQLLEQLMLRPGRVVATADLAATLQLDASARGPTSATSASSAPGRSAPPTHDRVSARCGISVPARRSDRRRHASSRQPSQCRPDATVSLRRLAGWRQALAIGIADGLRCSSSWRCGAPPSCPPARWPTASPSARGRTPADRSTGQAVWIPHTSPPWSRFPAGRGKAEARSDGRHDTRHCAATSPTTAQPCHRPTRRPASCASANG